MDELCEVLNYSSLIKKLITFYYTRLACSVTELFLPRTFVARKRPLRDVCTGRDHLGIVLASSSQAGMGHF